MQFGFMPGRGKTYTVFIMRQPQEKFLDKKNPFIQLSLIFEKAFDRAPRKVIQWAMRVVGLPKWIVAIVQAMHNDAKSKVRVNDSMSLTL